MFALTFFIGRAVQPYIQLPGSSSSSSSDATTSPESASSPPTPSKEAAAPPPASPKPAPAVVVERTSAPVQRTPPAGGERSPATGVGVASQLAQQQQTPTKASPPSPTPHQQQQQQQQQQPLQQAKVAAPVSKIPTSAKHSPPQAAHPTSQATEPQAAVGASSGKAQGPGSGVQPPVSKMSAEWCEQQVKTYQFSFEEADKDKSGNLSFDEVKAVMEKSGFRGGPEDLKRIFSHLDINQDQKISKYEFMAAMKKVPRVNMKEFALRRAFRMLDKDGSGFLTREEIIDATKKYAHMDISAEKISDLLLYLIREDQDQKVNYEEFVQVFGFRATGNHLLELFKKIDTDNSGKLSREELVKCIKADAELALKTDRISEMLVRHCKGDNQIDYQQFVKIYMEQKPEV